MEMWLWLFVFISSCLLLMWYVLVCLFGLSSVVGFIYVYFIGLW